MQTQTFSATVPKHSKNRGFCRYSFNGQEKDDEIAGITGANTTALFWEYDSRLGRRWNLDPKPQVSISDYACFLNSPIFLIDFFGDKVKLAFTSTSKDGTKTTTDYYYKKGNLYNSDGKLYKNDDANDPIFQLVKDQLNCLKTSSKNYNEMITKLEDSKSTHTINIDLNTESNKNETDNPLLQSLDINNSTTTTYNPLSVKDPEDKSRERNPMIALIHELTHAYQKDYGTNFNPTINSKDIKGKNAVIDLWEIEAVNKENILRRILYGESGIRKTYHGVIIPGRYLTN